MIKDIILKIITLLHVLFVLFILIAPFIPSNYILLLHFIICPFVMFHWYLNDNTCALTMVEKMAHKYFNGDPNYDPTKDCVTCKLINPIYDFTNNYDSFAKGAYITVTILWILTIIHLIYRIKAGYITNFVDLVSL
jgi:hypothetical protein